MELWLTVAIMMVLLVVLVLLMKYTTVYSYIKGHHVLYRAVNSKKKQYKRKRRHNFI